MDRLTFVAQAAGDEPAGGAAIGEAVGATAGAVVATAAIAVLIAGHRSGRIQLLARMSRATERVSGLPAWAALPAAVLGISLLVAVTGMYWDISLHIDNGRDAGPLANPAHYLILVGLYGALLAGVLSAALTTERPSPTAVRLGGGWWIPVGGLLIAACGAFALSGFPLDDIWHRIFGQDVTLWGPTHLMLIGGGSLAVLGAMALMSEAIGGFGRDPDRDGPSITLLIRRALLVGGFLVALSTFQGEFDFAVPQFRQVLQPILIMLAAGIGLVTARVYLGRFGALQAVAGFVAIRGFLAIMVGEVWDQTTPHFPLYLAEAAIVELVAIWIPARRPVSFALVSGSLIGTLGLAMAMAGALIGGWIGARLASDRIARTRQQRWAGAVGALAVAGLVGFGLYTSADSGVSATVDLNETAGGSERTVDATIRVDPPDAGDDADWLHVISWQGGSKLVVDELEQTGPGVYRSTEPLPVDGTWKTLLRLHEGNSLTSVPIYLPADPAIPAEEVPAGDGFTREFAAEKEFLQREAKTGAEALQVFAYLAVLAITLAFLSLVAWGLHRLAVTAEPAPGAPSPVGPPRRRPTVREPAAVTR